MDTSEPLPVSAWVKGKLEKDLECQDKGNGLKLTEGKFRWDIGKEHC